MVLAGPILSVMNEDETKTPPEGGVQYTLCFDAWAEEIATVNPDIVLMGPETTDGATCATTQQLSLDSPAWLSPFPLVVGHSSRSATADGLSLTPVIDRAGW